MRKVQSNLCSPAAGRGDNFDHWAGLRLGLQEVPGIRRQRRGNTETNWKSSKKSVFFFRSSFALYGNMSIRAELLIHFPVLTVRN